MTSTEKYSFTPGKYKHLTEPKARKRSEPLTAPNAEDKITPEGMDKGVRMRSIINIHSPEWGSWGIASSENGGWAIRNSRGDRMLFPDELSSWKWVS